MRPELSGGVLVANRGEIAIRIMRAAAESGVRVCAVYPRDDADSLHVAHADEAVLLPGRGAPAYLDVEQIIAAAAATGCTAIHPGYGFLSEDAGFARRCAEAGLVFVGPRPDTLALFGDKVAARALAVAHDVPVAAATPGPVDLAGAHAFLTGLGPGAAVLVKAVSGGGGRGMRLVRSLAELPDALDRARSEGRSEVYLEQVVAAARHVEVQVLGDGTGAVSSLGDRECSIQRRHQKLLEIAPAPTLPATVRAELAAAALRMTRAVSYRGLGTVEFLVDGAGGFVFIEANPRLQVEHTVTEAVTGIDLVAAQLAIAGGATLAELRLTPDEIPAPRGRAIQLRVNAETLDADGTACPAIGRLDVFEPPTGPGIRVDTHCHAGYSVNPHYDPLLAKVVVHTASEDLAVAAGKADRALGELRIEGVATNVDLLRAVLRHPDLAAGRAGTTFVETHLAELVAAAPAPTRRPAEPGSLDAPAPVPVVDDPGVIIAPTDATVVDVSAVAGAAVQAGDAVAVLEAMKMETVVTAPVSGVLDKVLVGVGDLVRAGDALAFLTPDDLAAADNGQTVEIDLDEIRPDLAELHRRQAGVLDGARPDAVAARHDRGRRTARENVDDLCDPGSFVEYGSLAIASMRGRRSIAELVAETPADGLVAGIGRVNGDLFAAEQARCAALSYDYTVLAGTQGHQSHRKKDRLFELVERLRLPVVFFTEGGGGRPGETDYAGVGFGDMPTFSLFARLSGQVPLVGIASGRCFAGNAALLGCCDVIIATRDATIGMAGPSMVEGGGLGRFRPEEIGPAPVQAANGVIDVLVDDDAAAVAAAKRYLGYFQGATTGWEQSDQRRLRAMVPANRRRGYAVRDVVEALADRGSVLELRAGFAAGMVTALARLAGRPVGVVANDPLHGGGAIDADGADKAARFLRLCEASGLPVVFLCDTPGFMVGPDAERQAQVRHFARLFLTGANLTVPTFTVVLRKAYGLGAIAMAGGGWRSPVLTVAWPTGEFGGMGVEGSVQLGHRRELAALVDPAERAALHDRLVAEAYAHGDALNVAGHFEIDDVIDPADTRDRLVRALGACPPGTVRDRRRTYVDSW